MLRAPMVDRQIACDRQQPGREFRQVPPISMPVAPRFLERPGREILGNGLIAQAITQKVIDARKLLDEDCVPTALPGCAGACRAARVLDVRARHDSLYEPAG